MTPADALDRVRQRLADAGAVVEAVDSLLSEQMAEQADQRLHDLAALLRCAESDIEGVLESLEGE